MFEICCESLIFGPFPGASVTQLQQDKIQTIRVVHFIAHVNSFSDGGQTPISTYSLQLIIYDYMVNKPMTDKYLK